MCVRQPLSNNHTQWAIADNALWLGSLLSNLACMANVYKLKWSFSVSWGCIKSVGF